MFAYSRLFASLRARIPHVRLRRFGPALLTACAVFGSGGGGCESAAPKAAGTVDPSESPAVVGSRNGLEVRWWVVDESFSDVGGVLGNYAVPTEDLGLKALGAWYASGLRVVAVPVEDLENIERLLPAVEVVSTTWLGQPGEWAEVVRGPRFSGERSVRVAGSYVRLGAGTPRVLAKAWMIPVAEAGGVGAALRVELRGEHEQVRGAEEEFSAAVTAASERTSAVELPRLNMEGMLRRGMAYVVTCESPGAEWKPGPLDGATPGRREYVLELDGDSLSENDESGGAAGGEGRVGRVERLGERVGEDTSGAEDGSGVGAAATREEQQPTAGAARRGIGPGESVGVSGALRGEEEAQTWGEAMLRARGGREELGSGRTRVRAARAVVVLIPRLPERFELLGR